MSVPGRVRDPGIGAAIGGLSAEAAAPCDSDALPGSDLSARSGFNWSGLRSPVGAIRWTPLGFGFESLERHCRWRRHVAKVAYNATQFDYCNFGSRWKIAGDRNGH